MFLFFCCSLFAAVQLADQPNVSSAAQLRLIQTRSTLASAQTIENQALAAFNLATQNKQSEQVLAELKLRLDIRTQETAAAQANATAAESTARADVETAKWNFFSSCMDKCAKLTAGVCVLYARGYVEVNKGKPAAERKFPKPKEGIGAGMTGLHQDIKNHTQRQQFLNSLGAKS